jgi:ATP-dependent protease ClpP protease subunit
MTQEWNEEQMPREAKSEPLRASVVTAGGTRLQTLLISGQIEGHSRLPAPAKASCYEEILPFLVRVEEDPEIQGLLILIHTVGGDVEAGLAMAEMIRGMKTPSVSLVLGGGHSIGIPLAVAADYSMIVPSATMTVHPVRINGLVLGVPQSFEYLQRMQDRICEFILENSRIEAGVLSELMRGRQDMATDIGTILSGKEAVDLGLVDELGSFSAAMDRLKERSGVKKE